MTSCSDSSSVLSESCREMIIFRDGDACVLCGHYPVDVAHIIARKDDDMGQLSWVRGVANSLKDFGKDDHGNMICLCPTHHWQFDHGYFTLVPSPNQRATMIEFEERDFAQRSACVERGEPDPGRRLPELSYEFEYIPIYYPRPLTFLHHPTDHDSEFFVFDTTDLRVCPLLHFRASHFAILVAAHSQIGIATRFQNSRTSTAYCEVIQLINLYNQRLGPPTLPQELHPTPVFTDLLGDFPTASHSMPSILGSPTVGSLGPSAHVPSTHTMDSLPALVASSNIGSSKLLVSLMDDKDHDNDNVAPPDDDLQAYAKERATTWKDIENRPQKYSTDTLGLWRYSSASDVINSI